MRKDINLNFLSIEQAQNQFLGQNKTTTTRTSEGLSFNEVLQQTNKTSTDTEVKFSKHALNRLNDRNIELTDNQMERLKDATKMAGEKGINDSLILVDELAFIVNTKNNTVITAMDQTSTEENVFTNIDGAVIN